MKNIVKALSLLSIIAVIPGAMAATSRVSVSGRVSPRLPSIAGYLASAGTTTMTTTTTTTSSLWGDVDCINNYTDCITADDACGADFEECTTNVLFHAQMPKCLSILYQCSATGINSLFGTSAVTALSTVQSTRTEGGVTEVDRYTYPLDGSVLGQRIIGGAIANKLTTEQCIRRYTNCLTRDDVCGSDFELCTSQREFKKQAVLCASTLARCENEGKRELFGSVENAAALRPGTQTISGETHNSRLKSMMEDGAQLAAMNAVKTCQRVTDNCLVSACMSNPWRCVEGTSMAKISAADFVGSATADSNTKTSKITKTDDALTSDADMYALTGSDIRKNLKAQCLETIGANKYCHMTYREKSPNNKELMDTDLQEDVFSLAYAARKEMVNTKIQEELKKFDTEAKEACVDTIASCAMRSCGGGIGSVCYTEAKTGKTTEVQINGTNTYNDIKSGCSAIVNTDPNCIYAATSSGNEGYVYSYMNKGAFDTLFTQASDTTATADPIGAVAYLNSVLATSYNDAAIERMKTQCRTTALACVKSMCGKDYINCYRTRTDIVSGSYDTDNARLDRSMNKMGGVLDYNIVMGLCLNTVQTSNACDEHLKIAASDLRKKVDTQSWGGATSVRSAWLDANTTKDASAHYNDVLIACRASDDQIKDTNTDCFGTLDPVNGSCDAVMDEDGCLYNEPVYLGQSEYLLQNAGKTLLQSLLADVEKEAQAKYNAKLNKEQRLCVDSNNGGVMGASDMGSTFMWVKLRSNKVPKNYVTKGLQPKQFTASNDLYGSFCRARITVMSDDKLIQETLGDKATAYFAVGDSFNCGSWIDEKILKEISDKVSNRALCKEGYGVWDDEKGECDTGKLSVKEKLAYTWGTVAPALASLGIGLGLTESGLIAKAITKSNGSNMIDKENRTSIMDDCERTATEAVKAVKGTSASSISATESQDVLTTEREYAYDSKRGVANGYAASAYEYCSKLGISADRGCRQFSLPRTEDSGKTAEFIANMERLTTLCRENDYPENQKGVKAARVAIPIVTTIVGGGLGAGITASVIAANKENIKNEAAQKWMDEIGEHIQCYLGADELGTYGDVVSFTID